MKASLKCSLHPVWLKIIQNRQPEAAVSEAPVAKPTANPALSYLIAMNRQESSSATGSRHPGVDMTGWEVEQMPTRLGGPAIVRKPSSNLRGWARVSVHPGDPRYPAQTHHQ